MLVPLLGLILASILPLAASHAVASRVIHVSPGGSDNGSGNANDPVRTVKRAVQMAADGDIVEIATGTYGESVQVYNKEVHLRAAPSADVIFDGAVPVDAWARAGGDWFAAWETNFQRAGLPHVYADRPEAGWPEQFFRDGVQLAEVTSRGAVLPGTFFNDTTNDRVWIGDDPTGRLVEGSALPWGIYLNRADHSSVRDIEVRRYATPISNMAAVRAYADDLVIDNLTVTDNAYMGLSAIGERIAISDSRSIDNGHLGMHGHLASDLSIVSSTVVGNNREDFDAWHAAGGVKITESTGITMTDSHVADNRGPGIWTDLDASRVRLARNYVHDNMRSGIELELSFDAIVVDNVVVDNGEAGVWVLESQDTQVWHNALFGNQRDIWVEDGPRSDVADVGLHANTLGGGAAPALLNVDDWTGARSAADMNVQADHNAYWLPPWSATAHLSRWANWPQPLSYSSTIETHRQATGQDMSGELSHSSGNPYVRDESNADYRRPAGATIAAPLSASIAALAGVPTGTRFAAGPLSAWQAPPPADPPPSTTTTIVAGTTTTTNPTTTTQPTPGGDIPSAVIGPGRTGRTAVRVDVSSTSMAARSAIAPGAAQIRREGPLVTPLAGWRALAALVHPAQ
jgi:nitrous oxidase accessory protein NosD